MEPVLISYRIKLNEQTTEVFDYKLDGQTFEIIASNKPANPPKWTELGFRQCSNCPLNAEENPHCPVALQLHDIVDRFHKTRSIDEVYLEVITEERTVSKTTALQNAISSMLELVMPISGCPNTAGMKPLARFHVPMASEEETVFHVAGMYLLAQYFLNNKGKQGVFSFDGLISSYADLHIVNKAVASRLQAVTSSDSVKNAITLVDMYSSLIPALLQDQLSELRGFFGAYLPEGSTETTSNLLEQAKAFKLELIPTEEEMKAEAEAAAAAEKQRQEQEEQGSMPEWLRKTVDKVAAPFTKASPANPDPARAVPVAAETAKPAEAPKKEYSSFVLSLELEPIAEAKPEDAAKPVPQPDKKRNLFALPDDDLPPAKPGAGKPAPVEAAKPKEEVQKAEDDDGGLKMIDFEP